MVSIIQYLAVRRSPNLPRLKKIDWTLEVENPNLLQRKCVFTFYLVPIFLLKLLGTPCRNAIHLYMIIKQIQPETYVSHWTSQHNLKCQAIWNGLWSYLVKSPISADHVHVSWTKELVQCAEHICKTICQILSLTLFYHF